MKSSAKQIILASAAAAAGGIALWLWRGAVILIAEGAFQNYGAFMIPLGITLASSCLFALAAILVVSPGVLYTSVVLAPATTFLVMPQTAPVAGAIGAAVLLVAFAARRIRREVEFSIAFSAGKILKAGLPIYFTALSVIIALFYYQQIAGREHPVDSVIPRAAVDLSVRALSGAFSDLQSIPHADSLITVDEFLAQNLEGQLKTQGIAPTATNKKEIAALVAEQRNELARRYGIPMKGGERLTDVLHRAITEKVQDLLGPYARFLPFLSAFAFFFALRTVSFPLYFGAVGLTALLIALLRRANMIISEKRSIEVERLTL